MALKIISYTYWPKMKQFVIAILSWMRISLDH